MATAKLLMAGCGAGFCADFRRSADAEPDLQLLPDVADPGELEKAVACLLPQVLLLDESWLASLPPMAIAQWRNRRPPTYTLVLTTKYSAHLLAVMGERGARGGLLRAASPACCAQSVRSVAAGACWIDAEALLDALRRERVAAGEPLAATSAQATLTARERQIVASVAAGLSNKQIGRLLGISDVTVKTHLHHIFEKRKLSGRLKLLASQVAAPNPQELPERRGASPDRRRPLVDGDRRRLGRRVNALMHRTTIAETGGVDARSPFWRRTSPTPASPRAAGFNGAEPVPVSLSGRGASDPFA